MTTRRSVPPLYGHAWPDTPDADKLAALALDLRWSWSHKADDLWKRLNPELWESTRNPWLILQTTSTVRLSIMLAETAFRQKLRELDAERHAYVESEAWFQARDDARSLSAAAYFSLEFALSEALPIYSGGLGNVAGDQLKAASDLGVPVVGVGLLYQQGYFRQVLDAGGAQRAYYPHNDPMQLPILPVRSEDGEWVRIRIDVPGIALWFRAWEARVGRVRLYLLDSNDAANPAPERGIAGELYGGDSETRLLQELALGIGGWRLLERLGIRAEVCHLNEGHAAFAVLERARTCMDSTGLSFAEALAITRAGNLFTTHTPVAAGFDRFAPELMARYLRSYAEERLAIPFTDFMALGRLDPGDDREPFNMAYLALRGSGQANGVSRLHGEVSRRIFEPLFPRRPVHEVPIGHVTNGVHTPSWDSEQADTLWTDSCGRERWRGTLEGVEATVRRLPDSDLWRMRCEARAAFVLQARGHLTRQLAASGAHEAEVAQASHVLNPSVLTVGFARRFAEYKRPNLLLLDTARLIRLLTNAERPVQLVIAGKAHPRDDIGKSMVQAWVRFIRTVPEVRPCALFLSDYDLTLAEHLVRGVDLWINTPRRPWEACGTSGMKILVNGGLNLSERDGWWAEAYRPEVGWAIGDGQERDADAAWDRHEADELYSILESQVVPCFYERDDEGIPRAWTAKMRESMATLTPQYSANRAVREYTQEYYLPAAIRYAERARNASAQGVEVARWQERIRRKWSEVRLANRQVAAHESGWRISIRAHLGELLPDDVRVELYADATARLGPECVAMAPCEPTGPVRAEHTYETVVGTARPPDHYTARVVPYHPAALVPLEAIQIAWEERPA